MKIPKGDVLLCGLLLLGGGIYTLLPKSHPIDFDYLQDVIFGGGMAIVGVMVLVYFRWSPELFIGVLAIPIVWSVWHMTFEGFTRNRVSLVVGSLLAMSAYWTLRKQIRHGRANESTRVDGQANEEQ